MDSFVVVVLAAGRGTRMRSKTIKVLHPLVGQPMIEHVIQTATQAGASRTIVVVGYQAELVQQSLRPPVQFALQKEQLGTGHAMMQTAQLLSECKGHVLVTYGDTPLYRASTFRALLDTHVKAGAAATILTSHLQDATGYGRIVRDEQGDFTKIVEQKDITDPAIEALTEINTGTYVFQLPEVFDLLSRVTNDNSQGEYYLPDVLPMLINEGRYVGTYVLEDATESLGINDRTQLATANKVLVERALEKLMLSGVTIVDPASTMIHPTVHIKEDTVIHPFTQITGETTIGTGCEIGPHALIHDSVIGDNVKIEGAKVEGSQVSNGVTIDHFALIRPGTFIAAGERVSPQ